MDSLYMDSEDGLYHGWGITVSATNQQWTFVCQSPQEKTCIFEKAYQTPTEALVAAREFVERDITKAVLSQVLAQWLGRGKIKFEEYLKLLKSVYRATHPASYWD